MTTKGSLSVSINTVQWFLVTDFLTCCTITR